MTQQILRAIQAQLGPDAVVSSRLLPRDEGATNGKAPAAEARPAEARAATAS